MVALKRHLLFKVLFQLVHARVELARNVSTLCSLHVQGRRQEVRDEVHNLTILVFILSLEQVLLAFHLDLLLLLGFLARVQTEVLVTEPNSQLILQILNVLPIVVFATNEAQAAALDVIVDLLQLVIDGLLLNVDLTKPLVPLVANDILCLFEYVSSFNYNKVS